MRSILMRISDNIYISEESELQQVLVCDKKLCATSLLDFGLGLRYVLCLLLLFISK